jgi:hypothetical protein
MVDTLSHPLPEEPIAELAPAAITPAVPDDQRAWRRALAVGIGAFVVSRVLTIIGAYSLVQFESLQRWNRRLPIADSSRRLIETHFLQWDGRWYRLIARVGYQSDLPEKISYVPDNGGATVAFFPGYPILARWFDHVFPGNLDYALLGINVVFGVVAVVLVGLLARDVFGVEVAERSMILFCLFPGSVVLSWSYSEPLLVVCAAACLLLLSRERWVAAGLFAALGTATRPNGLALVACCVVAAAIAIHRKRQWRSLLSVLLAPIGFLGFFWYLRVHTGEPNAWMRAQRDAWGEGWSWGATAVRYMWRFGENPLGTRWGPLYMHTTLAIAVLAFGLWCAVRKRVPLTWLVFSAGIGFFMLTPTIVSARPRFVWTAFPLAIAAAAWWPSGRRRSWDTLVVLNAAALVGFTVMYAGWVIIP